MLAPRNSRALTAIALLVAATSPDLAKEALAHGKTWLRDFAKRDPIDAALATVLVSAHLFYEAERGHNPKVNSIYDALVFVSTNLSVGFCDIYARTDAGKAIASALMTFGPALATNIFAQPTVATQAV